MQPDRKTGLDTPVDRDREEFFRAVHGGDVAFLEVFLCKHPDAAHWNTPDGTPPLVLAVGSYERDRWQADSRSWRQKEVMELLISYGADINAADVQGRTALLEECHNQQSEDIIDMLLKNGADPNAADTMKATALHILAARDWGEDIITLLVKAGAKLDAKDWLGNTPLHVAAGEGGLEFTAGHQDAVRLLISHGAPLDAVNANMRRPIDSANMNTDFQEEEGKRPTADIIEAAMKAQQGVKPSRGVSTAHDNGTAGDTAEQAVAPPRQPNIPRPPKDRFKPKL